MQINAKGLMTQYLKEGDGPAALVLHGWEMSYENVQPIVSVLAKTHTVYAVDLPGFGKTEQPKETWGVSDYVIFVKEFLDLVGVKKLDVLAGHSLGGRISIYGVASGKLSPSKLILIGSPSVKHSNSLRNVVYRIAAKLGKLALGLPGLRRYASGAREKLYQSANSTDYLRADRMRGIFLKIINEDLSSQAKEITVQTLLIWGADDDQVPLVDARYLHKAIKKSVLKIIQGAGHFVHNEQPNRVGRFIEDFLK